MPIDLTAVWKGREVWRSLDTDSLSIALRRIHRIAAEIEAEFETARGEAGHPVDRTLYISSAAHATVPDKSAIVLAHPTTSNLSPIIRTIGEVYDRYIADPKHSWSKRTAIAHATTRKWVVEAFGEQTALTGITREACRDFVELLRNMPAHADKRFPNLSIREAVDAAKVKGEKRLINAANVNAYINRFGGVMNWSMNEGYIDRNPLKGLKLTDPVKKRDKRRPFSTEQLTRIFGAPLYTGCQDDERGYASPGHQRPRRGRFWLPLLALFGGFRANECAQLEVCDIQRIDDVPCFRIAEGKSETGDEKRLKTTASDRVVPIHNELISFGFLAFVESQRVHGETDLFPELPLGHLGYRSTGLSRWFARFLISSDAAAPLTCFHSFRHNFRDALREAKVDRDIALLLGGWTTDGKGTAVADSYGSGYRASTLAEALNAVRYPALDLSHLKIRVDE